MSNYKPGTVAVATVRGVPGKRVIRCMEHGHRCWFVPGYMPSESDNGWWPDDDEVTDVRPLVVLDLAQNGPSFLAANLKAAAQGHREKGFSSTADDLMALVDQIEAQTRPLKPEEPTGLGAVVEDGDGSLWVHRGSAYLTAWVLCEPGGIGGSKPWSELDPVRVLSAGVDQ